MVPEVSLEPRAAVLRIAVTGDTGQGAEAVAAGIAAVHATEPIDAIVLAGDQFYPCGVTRTDDERWSLVAPLTEIGVPIFPVLGNHDFCGKADPDAQIRATDVIPHWNFPARQYVLRTAVADFAFIDTTPLAHGQANDTAAVIRNLWSGGLSECGGIATALERVGKADAYESGGSAAALRKWRIVVGHHPVVSSGYHGYFPRDEVRRMRTLIPELRDANVDLYIGGHDHHVELIRGRMLHLISGAGSAPIRPLKLRLRTVFPTEIGRERIGFAVVEIGATRMGVRFYDGKGRPKSEWFGVRRH